MVSILEFLEDVFETDDLAKFATGVEHGSVSLRTLSSLYERWPAWAAGVRIEQPSAGVLQPYAFASWGGLSHDALAVAWMKLVGDPGAATQLQRQLFRHLLFCDAVAVPDPFVANEAPGSSPNPRVAGMLVDEAAIRHWVSGVLRTLETYADLIKAGIVKIVPKPGTVTAQEVIDLDKAMTERERAAFPDQPPSWTGISHAGLAAASLLSQVRTAETFPGLDPYFPSSGHWTVFKRMHQLPAGVMVDDGRLPMLSRVLECELAQPEDLRVADIVAIRRDGHFDAWRRAVADGINRYEGLVGRDGPIASDQGALRSEISASVNDVAHTAKQDLGWLDQPVVSTTIELSLVVSAVVAAAAVPPVAGGLAGLAAVPLLARTFKRWRNTRGAIPRHVAVFRSPR